MTLPTGYTEVQYIQSSGTQYVDTEIPANSDVRVIAEFILLENNESTSCIFGAQGTDSKRYVFCAKSSGTFRSDYGTEYVTGPAVALNEYYVVDKNRNLCTLNGTLITCSAATFTDNSNLYIFARSCTSLSFSKIKLYKSRIYVADVLVRDYIPCINPDGEAGLYDTVNSKFYGNAGTGVFFAGPPRVKLPSGYKQLEYIQSTGTQYVDTDFIPNQDTRLIIDAQLLATSGYPSIFGSRNSNAKMFWCYANSATQILYGYASNKFTATCTMSDRLLIDANKNTFLVNGSALITDTTRTFAAVGDLYLHATNNAGTLQYASQMKSYSCKLYDNGALIRDYIPCSDSSGAIGLYDLVNSKFYPNAGTGVFTAGPEVTWPSNDAIYVKVNGIWRQIDGIKLL